jgi:large-conductance mechanosensitive channel
MYSNFEVEKDNTYDQNKEYTINNPSNNNPSNSTASNNNPSNSTASNSTASNSTASNSTASNSSDNNNKNFISVFKNFLNGKSDTILTAAGATAIAFAFKDLVLSIATNIIHPLFRLLIVSFKLNNYVDMGEFNKSQNMSKNLMNFFTTLLSFISVVLITYYSIKGLNDTFNILDNMQ